MMDTGLFGSLWELYHQVYIPPAWGRGREGGVNVAPSACYSESLGWRLWSHVPTEEKIPQIASFTCSLFWFFPRRWPHTEGIIVLIHRRTLLSGWKITFWRLSKWVLFPTLLVTLSKMPFLHLLNGTINLHLCHSSVTKICYKMLAVYFQLLLAK